MALVATITGADMTASQQVINDVLPKIQIVTTGTQTVFDANFTANVASDIVVYKRLNTEDADDATQLVSSSDYTVSFIGSQQFVRVTFSVGIPTDYIVTIIRDTPADRLNLYTNTNFVPSMLNQDIGLLTLVDQQSQLYNEQVAPHYNLSESLNDPETIDMILPKLAAGQIWRKNDDNTAIVAVTLDIDDIPAPSSAYYILRKDESVLTNSQNLGALGNGLLKQAVSSGIATLALAIAATDYWAPGDALTRTQVPTTDDDVVNKLYADSIASGFNFLKPVRAASTANFTSTYDNGASGIGATLTATSNGAASIDSVSLSLNDRVLFKDQTNTFENGVYYVSQVGDGSNPAIYTRTTDFDTPSEIQPNTLISVSEGSQNAETIWRETQVVTDIGTDPISFNLFGLNPSDVMTLSTNQTATGKKTFSNDVNLDSGATLTLNSTVSIDEILDEDDMASDSNTAVPTQQSVKAYVDGKNGAGINNIFIAGDFDTNPWQRGTNFPAAVAGAYHADRWRTSYTTSAVVTMAKVADAPTVAEADYFTQNCLGMEVTTADTTIAATDIFYHLQLVEGYNFLPIAQRESTISFWVKATVTGVYCFVCHNSAADMSFIAEYTINSANTWEYKTVTVPASPSAGTWNYTNGTGITCQFIMAGGSNFYGVTGWQAGGLYCTANQVNALATVGNIWRLALVKWEVGAVATPFVGRTIQEELLLCQRYYWKTFPQGVAPVQNVGNANGAIGYRVQVTGVANAGVLVRPPVIMRATPTVTGYNPLAANALWRNISNASDSGALSLSNSADNEFFANNVQVAADTVSHFMAIHATAESEL